MHVYEIYIDTVERISLTVILDFVSFVMHIHRYVHACMHAYMHAYIDTYVRTYVRTDVHYVALHYRDKLAVWRVYRSLASLLLAQLSLRGQTPQGSSHLPYLCVPKYYLIHLETLNVFGFCSWSFEKSLSRRFPCGGWRTEKEYLRGFATPGRK